MHFHLSHTEPQRAARYLEKDVLSIYTGHHYPLHASVSGFIRMERESHFRVQSGGKDKQKH